MTNEELLEKAKRDYPVGTKFKCKYNSGLLCEVTTDGRWDTVNISGKPSVIFYPKEGFGKYAYLEYLSTEWAEIVELPNQKNTPQFEIGKWYKITIEGYIWFLKIKSFNSFSGYLTFENLDNENKYHSIGNININNENWKTIKFELLTNLSKIQQYLPDNHPDKIVKQESNMFKKGDYIVTLVDYTAIIRNNLIFKQKENSKYLNVENDGTNPGNFWVGIEYNDKHLWRYATSEEIVEYDKLDKPYDVTTLQKKQYDYEVVHCKTQKEWDFVLSKDNPFKKLDVSEINWNFYKENSVIFINNEKWTNTNLDWASKSNCKIYSFEEWCNKFGYKLDFMNKEETNNSIPEYVECVKICFRDWDCKDEKVGNIYKTSELPKWVTGWSTKYFWKNFYSSNYKPSTKEAYEAQFKQNTISNNDIIEVEKTDYILFKKPKVKKSYIIQMDQEPILIKKKSNKFALNLL